MTRLIKFLKSFIQFKKTKTQDFFELEKLTALHEAAHVVATYLSLYHNLIGNISLISDTTGETFVTISRRKIDQSGKISTNNIQFDPDLIIDAAIIFYAGFEAEKIYCQKYNQTPDISHSLNDYNRVRDLINNANGEMEISNVNLISLSKQIVVEYWDAILTIADQILNSQNRTLEAIDAVETLNKGFK